MVSPEILNQCQAIITYQFRTPDLLNAALTHSSSAENRLHSNERLEFLGDAVLGLIVCQRLYELYPDHLEGELTKLKSAVVSRRTCAAISNALGLTALIRVGRGMEGVGNRPNSLAAGVFESIVAAIYLDGGFESARSFVLKHAESWIAQYATTTHQQNYKSMLQQYVQRHLGGTPTYEVLDEAGPDHNKSFQVRVLADQRGFGSAWGNTKKDAEQKAALQALQELGIVDEHGHEARPPAVT